MGLTQKILVFTSAIVVAMVAITLSYTTIEANRLAQDTIHQMLGETRQVWETFQADRYQKLRLGVGVLANDPGFKALVEKGDELTVADTLQERGVDLGSEFIIATDPDGYVVARSDRQDAQGQDLSEQPVVVEALDDEGAATVWRQDGRLYHAVSVPMFTGPVFYGALVAGYPIDEQLADDIRKLTHSEVVFFTDEPDGTSRIAVSSLGPAREEALAGLLGRTELPSEASETLAEASETFDVPIPGDPSIGTRVALEALGGERIGSVLAMRSLAGETAAFRRFRNSLIAVSLVVALLALAAGYLAASRVTGPVRKLVDLVERARDGSFSGAVSVSTGDEIGVLARAFNGLIADLREKEQMIGFLREGLTMIRQGQTADTDTSSGGTGRSEAATTIIPAQRSAVTDAMRLKPGELFAGRYEIASTLGKGGMGIVYKARDDQLDEDVALKLLRPEVVSRDETMLDRFKQELKLARKITHRNVLRTHDFSESAGVPYISMEYVEGVMLKDLIKSKGALPLGVGLRVAKQICHGLEAAHRQGVVHRDIKPQNMLILPENGELKIMDFGIARVSDVAADGGLTTEGTVMGTPDYMPPEQAQGRPADFRSDIYSLGVVLFEMFTGRLPFMGESPMATVVMQIQEPPPAPRSLNPDLPAEIETIVLRCLAKSPEDRYAEVSQLHEALSAASSRIDASAAA